MKLKEFSQSDCLKLADPYCVFDIRKNVPKKGWLYLIEDPFLYLIAGPFLYLITGPPCNSFYSKKTLISLISKNYELNN